MRMPLIGTKEFNCVFDRLHQKPHQNPQTTIKAEISPSATVHDDVLCVYIKDI